MAPLGFVPGLRYSFSVALATLLAAPVVGREDRSRNLMYVLVVPTDAEPTVALEPPTISTTPWPFRLTCCVAVLLDKNPSSVTVPDCAQARPGSTASVISRTFGKIKRDKNLRIKPPPGPCERARRL